MKEIPEIKLNFKTVTKGRNGIDSGEPRVEYIESPSKKKDKILRIKELYEK